MQDTTAKKGDPQQLTVVFLAGRRAHGSWGGSQDPFFFQHTFLYTEHQIIQAGLTLKVGK